ncbi:MAG: hypothetical protein QNJ54_36735 [Prochloraceae cyanobacterium]|nr:hypothetical protein [Prochloraceae cyanobacterium]
MTEPIRTIQIKIDIISQKAFAKLVEKYKQKIIATALSNKKLKPNQHFVHPLSETWKGDQEYINTFGFASMLINGVRNSHGKFSEDPEKCEQILKDILIKTNPILNLSKTIAEIKMHNLKEIMMVCNCVANADMSQFESKE